MRTLHPALRVTDLATSLDFYRAVGYVVVGSVDLGAGETLTMLKFPADVIVTLELVHRPAGEPVDIGNGLSHLAVQVDNLGEMIEALANAGLITGPIALPGGPAGPKTSWITDPDGYRIELVEWPPGHAYGITAADFSSPSDLTDRRASTAPPPAPGPAGSADACIGPPLRCSRTFQVRSAAVLGASFASAARPSLALGVVALLTRRSVTCFWRA